MTGDGGATGEPRDPLPAGDPRGSIIERFRGTEWDAQANQPPPPPPPRATSVSRSFVLTVGGVALLLIVAISALVVLHPGTPTPTAFVPPSVRPTPTAAPGADVLARVWGVVSDASLSYHVESAGKLSAKSGDQRFSQQYTLALDVSDDNYAGTIAIVDRGRFVLDRFDGTIYIRKAGTTKWEVTPNSNRDYRQQPLMAIDDPRELTYVNSFVEKGVLFHRFTGNEAYRPSVARMFVLGIFDFPFETLDLHMELVVTNDGVPVRASFSCRVAADPTHGIPSFSGSATFTFSKFGQGPKISAPPNT